MKKKILAGTGFNGLIGSQILPLLSSHYKIISLSQEDMDITKKENVNTIIDKLEFDYFLHMASYTNVDLCETNQETAYKINVAGTSNLFSAVIRKNKLFIYTSSDFVFDGKNPPFTEKSLPNPVIYYGLTKYLGEQIIKNNGIIVRYGYPFGKRSAVKKDIVHTVADCIKTKKSVYAVSDNLITPTFIDDIAYNINLLIKKAQKGIYHISGNTSLSTYDFFRKIAHIIGEKSCIKPITYSMYYQNKVIRPKYLQITSLYKNLFSHTPLDTALEQVLSNIFRKKLVYN